MTRPNLLLSTSTILRSARLGLRCKLLLLPLVTLFGAWKSEHLLRRHPLRGFPSRFVSCSVVEVREGFGV